MQTAPVAQLHEPDVWVRRAQLSLASVIIVAIALLADGGELGFRWTMLVAVSVFGAVYQLVMQRAERADVRV